MIGEPFESIIYRFMKDLDYEQYLDDIPKCKEMFFEYCNGKYKKKAENFIKIFEEKSKAVYKFKHIIGEMPLCSAVSCVKEVRKGTKFLPGIVQEFFSSDLYDGFHVIYNKELTLSNKEEK
jgi:hypothetical protein